MENKTFAYIRVSSKTQNVARQVEELKQYVKNERDIFIDKLSGKDFQREMYQALKWQIRPGDILYVKELERFGRNKAEIKKELEFFKEKGVLVRIMDIPTTMMDFSQFGGLQKTIMEMVHNILIEVLGTIAETERYRIKQRQREGIAIAKKQGVKFGRRKINFPEAWEKYYQEWKNKNMLAVQCMKELNLSKTSFYRLVKRWENGE